MTKEQLAKTLDSREVDSLLSGDDSLIASENNLVVVFAYSDDLVELEGAIVDELDCWQGGTFYYDQLKERWIDIDDSFEGVNLEECFTISAICNDKTKYEGLWYLQTNLPHARFEAKKDDEPFCSGFVFDYNDLNKKPPNE